MNWFSRFRNRAFWVSLASFVLLILHFFGVNVAPEAYNQYVNLVLSLLVLLGLVNDPTSGNWYSDEVKLRDKQ